MQSVDRVKRGRPKKHYESVDEIREFLQVSRGTLYKFMQQGMPYTLVGYNRRFDRKAVVKWVEARSERIKNGTELGVAWLEENGQ